MSAKDAQKNDNSSVEKSSSNDMDARLQMWRFLFQLLISAAALAWSGLNPHVSAADLAPSSSSNMFTNPVVTALVFEHLQDQLRQTQSALEKMRQQLEMNDQRATQHLRDQIARLTSRVEDQQLERLRLAETLDQSNRRVIFYAGFFAATVIVVLVITAWVQFRTTQQLTRYALTVRPGGSMVFEAPTNISVKPPVTPPESLRLTSGLDRLELRIQQLEAAASRKKIPLIQNLPESVQADGAPLESRPSVASAAATKPVSQASPSSVSKGTDGSPINSPSSAKPPTQEFPLSPATDRVTESISGPVGLTEPNSALAAKQKRNQVEGMVGKGMALLQMGKDQSALECFEQAIGMDPNVADAWIKKGTVLEKLDRMEEAVGCYDRAISINPLSTLAYLHKGGVCNRLERFDEALDCYELALKHQPDARASSASA